MALRLQDRKIGVKRFRFMAHKDKWGKNHEGRPSTERGSEKREGLVSLLGGQRSVGVQQPGRKKKKKNRIRSARKKKKTLVWEKGGGGKKGKDQSVETGRGALAHPTVFFRGKERERIRSRESLLTPKLRKGKAGAAPLGGQLESFWVVSGGRQDQGGGGQSTGSKGTQNKNKMIEATPAKVRSLKRKPEEKYGSQVGKRLFELGKGGGRKATGGT